MKWKSSFLTQGSRAWPDLSSQGWGHTSCERNSMPPLYLNSYLLHSAALTSTDTNDSTPLLNDIFSAFVLPNKWNSGSYICFIGSLQSDFPLQDPDVPEHRSWGNLQAASCSHSFAYANPPPGMSFPDLRPAEPFVSKDIFGNLNASPGPLCISFTDTTMSQWLVCVAGSLLTRWVDECNGYILLILEFPATNRVTQWMLMGDNKNL